jgi:hypothetical protein
MGNLEEPNDWSFLAEGRHHAVFKYTGSNSQYVGKVLRTEKVITETKHGSHIASDCELNYCNNVIQPWMSTKYTVGMQAISVSQHFILGLHKTLIGMDRRKEPLDLNQRTAYLLNDLSNICRNIPLPVLKGKVRHSCSVELKVKNGLKCCSPFSTDLTSLKHRFNRFQYMQYVKLWETQGNMKLPWGGSFESLSSYDPSQLCSRQKSQVDHALSALMSNPQNNLSVSYNDRLIYGLKLTDIDTLKSTCSSLLGYSDVTASAPSGGIDAFSALISNILCSESILERLQYIQALDIFDVDGLECLFSHACSLHGRTNKCMCAVQSPVSTHSLLRDLSRTYDSACDSACDGEDCSCCEGGEDGERSEYTTIAFDDKEDVLNRYCWKCQEGVIEAIGDTLLDPLLPQSEVLKHVRERIAEARYERNDVRRGAECVLKGVVGVCEGRGANGASKESTELSCDSFSSLCDGERDGVNDGGVCGGAGGEGWVDAWCMLYELVSDGGFNTDKARRQAARDIVHALNMMDTVRLLQVWLMALAASDASVVVCLSPLQLQSEDIDLSCSENEEISERRSEGRSENGGGVSLQDSIEVIQRQTESSSGIIAIHRNLCTPTSSHDRDRSCRRAEFFAYEVSVIDVGPKSLNKIKEKIRTEAETYSHASKGYELSLMKEDKEGSCT